MSTVHSILKVIEPHPRSNFKDKAIAVGLAMLVWVAVNAEETVLELFDPVPVELENVPPRLAIAADWQETISVRARGSQRDLDNLSTGRMSPRLDLSGATAGENIFRLSAEDLSVPSGVQIERIDPSQIVIVLEELVEKEVPVSPVTAGEPAPGYEVVGRSTNPETTLVSGPRSAVDAVERVETRTVDVRDAEGSFVEMVLLHTDNPLVVLRGARQVEMHIEILERAETREFEAVRVEVINAQYQVAVNPAELAVFLRGPPSLLEQIDRDAMRLIIDAADLSPRADDYLIAPTIDLGREDLGSLIELVTTVPQREINVHVFNQPARRSLSNR